MRWLCALCLLSGCATLTPARPLDPGQHSISATFGGPMFSFAGAPLPVPNIVIEGRSGLPDLWDRPIDVNYGANITASAFGIAGIHGGASWMILDQKDAIPAITLIDRQFLYTNILDQRKEIPGLAAVNQIELTASWRRDRSLLYTGVGEYVVFSDPSLLLTPFAGAQLDLGKSQRWILQLEGRHYAINRIDAYDSIQWISYGTGALGVNIGVARTFGGAR